MPARPICFVIMPYGVRRTSTSEGADAPTKVNFDRLWATAIEPAIADIGYEAIRADQDLGALIILEMIQRLAISDLVVAEVSIPNGNVYYEVGLRHAAKPNNCVLISANWAKPLFDIDQMRRISYPLPAENVDATTASAIRKLLKDAIPQHAKGSSPFYMALPGYPDLSGCDFRRTLDELATFQGEVKAVRNSPSGSRRQGALDLRTRYHTNGDPVQLAVALELLYLLRDCTDWKTTLQFIDELPPQIKDMASVQEQAAVAQSKNGEDIAAIATLEKLIQRYGESSERRGLIGGRYKALMAASADPDDKARYLDLAIDAYKRGMYCDLNDYYPSSNLTRLYQTRDEEGDKERARIAAAVCEVACERAKSTNAEDKWLRATFLGAAFDAGDVRRAKQLAQDVRKEGAARWQLTTTLKDLERAISFQDADTARELEQILDELRPLS